MTLSQIVGPETLSPLSFGKLTQALAGWQGITFIFFEGVAFYLSITAQNKAYKIYTALYPDKIEK